MKLNRKDYLLGEKAGSFISLHDASSHFAFYTRQIIFDVNWEVLLHAEYLSDLVPSNYHLFRSILHFFAEECLVTEIQK